MQAGRPPVRVCSLRRRRCARPPSLLYFIPVGGGRALRASAKEKTDCPARPLSARALGSPFFLLWPMLTMLSRKAVSVSATHTRAFLSPTGFLMDSCRVPFAPSSCVFQPFLGRPCYFARESGGLHAPFGLSIVLVPPILPGNLAGLLGARFCFCFIRASCSVGLSMLLRRRPLTPKKKHISIFP